MNTLIALILSLFTLTTTAAFAQGHHPPHHVKHNMVMFGSNQIFASHIVFKVPHNYEVILELALDPASRRAYLAERARFPFDQIIFLLDESSIADVDRMPRISGTITRTDAQGQRITVVPHLTVPRANYRIVFFNELPLSLENKTPFSPVRTEMNQLSCRCSPRAVKCEDPGSSGSFCRCSDGRTYTTCG